MPDFFQAPDPATTQVDPRMMAQMLMRNGRAMPQVQTAIPQNAGWGGALAGGVMNGIKNYGSADAARAFNILNGG